MAQWQILDNFHIPANPCGHLPTVSRNPKLYQEGGLDNLPKMPRNPWPFPDKTWTIYQEYWQILGQLCREILDNLPRILTNSWPFAKKSWTICQETLNHLPRMPQILGHLPRLPRTICRKCQQILGHLPRFPRIAIEICLPRMPSLPWLALAAGSFGSLGSQ